MSSKFRFDGQHYGQCRVLRNRTRESASSWHVVDGIGVCITFQMFPPGKKRCRAEFGHQAVAQQNQKINRNHQQGKSADLREHKLDSVIKKLLNQIQKCKGMHKKKRLSGRKDINQ